MLNIEIGKGLSIAVDGDKLQKVPTVWNHVVYIGLRNLLMDSHASVKREDYAVGDDGTKLWRDAAMAAALKKLDAMERGEIRANATRTRTTDPLEAECNRLARVWVHNATAKDGFAFDEIATALHLPFGTSDEQKIVKTAMIARRAKHADTVATAQLNVEAANKNATTIDLADFGL